MYGKEGLISPNTYTHIYIYSVYIFIIYNCKINIYFTVYNGFDNIVQKERLNLRYLMFHDAYFEGKINVKLKKKYVIL